jgi:hypothetical protein
MVNENYRGPDVSDLVLARLIVRESLEPRDIARDYGVSSVEAERIATEAQGVLTEVRARRTLG